MTDVRREDGASYRRRGAAARRRVAHTGRDAAPDGGRRNPDGGGAARASADEAVAAASASDFRSPQGHRADTAAQDGTQAVRLNLADEHAVREAALEFAARFRGELTGLLVQRMVPGGVEMLVGALHDPTFGPVVVCGSGGVLVDLLADSAFRHPPVDDRGRGGNDPTS